MASFIKTSLPLRFRLCNEWDFEIGIQPREDLNIGNTPLLYHLNTRTIFSLVDAGDLEERLETWKLEFRCAI